MVHTVDICSRGEARVSVEGMCEVGICSVWIAVFLEMRRISLEPGDKVKISVGHTRFKTS